MTRPLRADIAERSARERCQLASARRDAELALEACDMLTELYRAGYVLFPFADPSEMTARPVKLRTRFEGSCAACGEPISVGDVIWWTRGKQGIDCADCGRRS